MDETKAAGVDTEAAPFFTWKDHLFGDNIGAVTAKLMMGGVALVVIYMGAGLVFLDGGVVDLFTKPN
jgi:hypothetical protein